MLLCRLFLTILVAVQLVLLSGAVERTAFDAALKRWSSGEEAFYKTYQAGEPHPPIQSKRIVAPSVVPKRTFPPTSTADDGESEGDAAPQAISTKAPADRWRAVPPPPTPAPTNEEDLPLGDSDSATAKLRSFSEVCSEDSSNLCNEVNPFNATFCLVSKKYSLSNDCRDYITAKVNCYLTTEKLCGGAESHLRCLYQHRYHSSLPRVCTGTRFFEYVRSGVSLKDVLLDQSISTS
jgi:hypothetical protein